MKIRIAPLFACFSFLIPFRGYSQNFEITARVVDSATFEPVAFSTIYLREHKGTIADETGFFRLQVDAEHRRDTLHISCIGYQERGIPLQDRAGSGLDTIYLHPVVIGIEELQVATKSRRKPEPKRIIRMALSAIPANYPDFPVQYNGYYREYIKEEEEYINLFESIMDLEDPGIKSLDNFEAGLLYKRINSNFRLDSLLMRPYDNREKIVPYSFMPISLNNELVILRAHDPVRNYNRHSLYFFDRLEKDFIRNHDFSAPKLTYLNDRPYYLINYRDNRKYMVGNTHISTQGSIYIDAANYGIKRIVYESTMDNGLNRRRLFGLNLEYTLDNGWYLLHYLSFNNLFYTRNFALNHTGIREDKVSLTFNRPLNEADEDKFDKFSVFLEGEKQEIKEIDINDRKVYLTFDKKSTLGEKLKINLWPRNLTTRYKIARNQEYLAENLRFEFSGLGDIYDNKLADNEFNEYYQYREFFTNRACPDRAEITSNLIDKSIPVIENRIFGEFSGDTSWLNTPLIRENVTTKTVFSGNPKINNFLEGGYRNNENRVNELVYIQTDREVYAPEDTLWFKAYIRNKKFLTGSELSKVFHVLLADESGRVVHQDKYLVEDAAVAGQIGLENSLGEGTYYLVGYSSWMENFGTESLFSKRILVEKEKRDGHMLAAAFDRSGYYPGDTVRMLVNCYDDFNRTVDDVSFRYRFVQDHKVILRGQGTTERSWLEPIRLVLPETPGSQPLVELRSIYRSEVLDTAYAIPVMNLVHLDFFPEGGYCLNGVPASLAFKATDGNGKPVDVKGEVIEADGSVITASESVHQGMGSFTFTPRKDNPYYFRVLEPPLVQTLFALPEGKERGWQLRRTHRDNESGIELEVFNAHTGNDTALITVMVREYLCYYTVIRTRGKTTVRIPLEKIPPGIAVVTLFDNRLVPRAERLIYMKPAHGIKATLQSDRQAYLTRDSVRIILHLDGEQPVFSGGSFALSVIDNQLCSTGALNEPGIRSSFLLSPEIHGTINNPEYYLNGDNADAPDHLDLLLMTQGWRKYTSSGTPGNKDVISGTLFRPTISSVAEPVEGRITARFGGNSTSIPVGKNGTFTFLPDYRPGQSNEIFLYAEDKRGRSNLSIVMDSTDFEDQLEGYLQFLADSMSGEKISPGFSREQLQDHFSYRLENHYWLEEVVIRKTVEKKELNIADLAINKRVAKPEELEMAFEMEDLENIVRKINITGSPIYYVVDGILQFTYESSGTDFPVMIPDYSYAYRIRPEEIESYTVVAGQEVQALYGYGIMYVIDVKTKPISSRPDSKWSNPLIIKDFALKKEFYRPVYDTEARRYSTVPDLRKTIHWEPDLRVNEDGEAAVTFYNGDRYTRIKCIMEGITEEGVPVQAETYYTVSLARE